MVGGFDDGIHGMGDRESMLPVMVRYCSVVLPYSECELHQAVNIESGK